MSTAYMTNIDLTAPPVIRMIGRRSLVIGVVFSVIAIGLGFTNPAVFYRGYLVSFMDWLGICLGSMVILMVRHLTGGGWGMVIRRILGAAMRTVPLMAAFFVPLAVFGWRHLYPWAMAPEAIENRTIREHLVHNEFVKSGYLNPRGFILRAILYFAIWNLLSYLLTRWSKEQDKPPVTDHSLRFKAVSGPGIILYAFTISFAAIDWVMSLDPSWISTIYGLLFVAGELISALCFAVVIERILFKYKPMSDLLRPDFVHDHGKFMMTFVMLWAYFSFSQWLIIWAGNLPEEITWYLRRLLGGWGYVGLFLAIFQFCVPFALLLSRPLKRDITKLVWLAAWLVVVRYIDLFWLVEPNFSTTFHVTWADLVIPFAMGGLWLAFFCHNLSSIPLLPAYDVYAKQVLEPKHE